MKEWNNLSFKDKLEVLEAICTIFVTIMAIWGTISAWESGLWHKVKRIVEYSHDKIVTEEAQFKNH